MCQRVFFFPSSFQEEKEIPAEEERELSIGENVLSLEIVVWDTDFPKSTS